VRYGESRGRDQGIFKKGLSISSYFFSFFFDVRHTKTLTEKGEKSVNGESNSSNPPSLAIAQERGRRRITEEDRNQIFPIKFETYVEVPSNSYLFYESKQLLELMGI